MFQNRGLAKPAAENCLYVLETLKFLVRIQCLLLLRFIARYLLMKRENKFFPLESQARTIVPSAPRRGVGLQPSPCCVYSSIQAEE